VTIESVLLELLKGGGASGFERSGQAGEARVELPARETCYCLFVGPCPPFLPPPGKSMTGDFCLTTGGKIGPVGLQWCPPMKIVPGGQLIPSADPGVAKPSANVAVKTAEPDIFIFTIGS